MKTFNLNSYILVQITEYGWEFLHKNEDASYIKYSIIPYKEIIDGVEYYKLQAHQVIGLFGKAVWAAYPCPININILIPE